MFSLTGISTRDLLLMMTATAVGVGIVTAYVAHELRDLFPQRTHDVWHDRPQLTEDRIEQVHNTEWPTCDLFPELTIPESGLSDSVWPRK